MARWRQVYNRALDKSEFIPIDDSAAKLDAAQGKNLNIIRGNFDTFKSPIDGVLITNQRDYDDHCRKHNVVPAQEYTPEFYAKKERERERFYKGENTAAETFKRKQEIYNNWTEMERKHER